MAEKIIIFLEKAKCIICLSNNTRKTVNASKCNTDTLSDLLSPRHFSNVQTLFFLFTIVTILHNVTTLIRTCFNSLKKVLLLRLRWFRDVKFMVLRKLRSLIFL